MIGDTARMATDYALVQFTGGLALKGLSKFSQLRNIPKVASVFGEESALTTSLQRLERFSSNPVNKDYFGWFNQTLVDNYQEGKSVGMTNTQAAVYGSVQSLLTAFLARINPDVKFFKLYKELDEDKKIIIEFKDNGKGVAEKLNLPESFLVEHILSKNVDGCLNDPTLDNNGKPKRGKK